MRKRNKLIQGVGVNDADYEIGSIVNGKRKQCPYYTKWQSMIVRCYSLKYQMEYPTYQGCTVCDEWLTFSNFKAWMETQDWRGKHLDKDLLVQGNKVYSPETCVFVDSMVNLFTIDSAATRGNYPLGVYLHECGKYRARCSNPFTKRGECLGLFICPNQAHVAWKKRKHELACQLADLQTDERVAKALRVRYQ